MLHPEEEEQTVTSSFLSAALTAMFASHNHPSVESYIPQKVLSSSISLRSRSDRPPWCEYDAVLCSTQSANWFVSSGLVLIGPTSGR